MTTTELIKILQDNEKGGISHKSRQISLTVNGRYLPDPQITLLGTGDGIAGPEIDFDVNGEWFEHKVDETDEMFDRIRTEIEKLRPNLRPEQMTDYDYAMVDVVNDIVAIIDKYKAERSKET